MTCSCPRPCESDQPHGDDPARETFMCAHSGIPAPRPAWLRLLGLEIPYSIDEEGALCHVLEPSGAQRGEVSIMSFGVLHGFPDQPEAYLVNLTNALYNPHHDPRMRHLTAYHDEVYDRVMSTGDAGQLSARSARRVLEIDQSAHRYALETATPRQSVTCLVCCKGGRHRAPAMAWSISAHLWREGYTIRLRHRDILRDVVETARPAPGSR